MFATGKVTTDRETIRSWAEKRYAFPAVQVIGEEGTAEMELCFGFPGCENLNRIQAITWEEFFQLFDRSRLVFMYQEQEAGLLPTYNFI